MAIKIKFDGWEDLLEEVKRTEGDMDRVSRECAEKSAQIFEAELKSEMKTSDKSGGTSRLADRMPKYTVEKSGNAYIARVGYEGTSYDPDNLSDYYKAVFINYGTPRIKARSFVKRAKRSAKGKIEAEAKSALEKMTKGLKT